LGYSNTNGELSIEFRSGEITFFFFFITVLNYNILLNFAYFLTASKS